MSNLVIETLQLWPRKSRTLIKEKGLSVSKLIAIFDNHIIFPWDDNYDQQRMLFSTQIQERPLFIVQAVYERYIIETLNLLKQYNLTIRIVGGRHSTALQNPDIFLDISSIDSIVKDGKYLRVGAGATQGQVNAYLFDKHPELYFPGAKPNHPNSLAFPGGSAATVGVAGISTVGGIGTLRRTLGLTVDSIKAFKIIIPPRINSPACSIMASKSRNSDLFWALLGGGAANFGVVTEIIYHTLKVNDVILYQISWDFSDARKVLIKWQKTAPSRPNAYNEDLAIFTQGNSKLGINLIGIYVIPRNETIIEAKLNITRELKSLGGDLVLAEASTYTDVYKKFVDERVYHNFSVGKTFLTHEIVPADILLDRLELMRNTNGQAYIGLQLMGGKISDRKSSETAFFARKSKFFVDIFNFWDSAVDQEVNMKWNGQTFKGLYDIIGPYTYLGFPVPNLPNHLNAYYGTNKERLVKVKKAIDPLGLLKFPGSI